MLFAGRLYPVRYPKGGESGGLVRLGGVILSSIYVFISRVRVFKVLSTATITFAALVSYIYFFPLRSLSFYLSAKA